MGASQRRVDTPTPTPIDQLVSTWIVEPTAARFPGLTIGDAMKSTIRHHVPMFKPYDQNGLRNKEKLAESSWMVIGSICIYIYIWGFPKMVLPNNHGFPTKNDHFGVLLGYHHLRKHP